MRILNASLDDGLITRPEDIWEVDSTIDKATLLYVLRSSSLQPLHIFFPLEETQLWNAFDWNKLRRDQMRGLQFSSSELGVRIYVLGTVSNDGDHELNIKIAKARIFGVIEFLKDQLKIPLRAFRGGWIGSETLQFTPSDAMFLNIESRDYRDDPLILNHAVHIVVYSCSTSIDPPAKAPIADSGKPSDTQVPLEEMVRTNLSHTRASFRSSKRTLKLYHTEAGVHYNAADISSLIEKTEDSALSALADRKLIALRSYVEDQFDLLKSSLNSSVGSRCNSWSISCSSIRLASLAATTSRESNHSFVDVGVAASVFSKIDNLLSLLMRSSAKLTVTVCVISEPAGANFVLHPKKDPKNLRTMSTNGLIKDLWIGRYSYQVIKSGFKVAAFDFDFIDDASSVIECRLVKNDEKEFPLACRVGERKAEEQCHAR